MFTARTWAWALTWKSDPGENKVLHCEISQGGFSIKSGGKKSIELPVDLTLKKTPWRWASNLGTRGKLSKLPNAGERHHISFACRDVVWPSCKGSHEMSTKWLVLASSWYWWLVWLRRLGGGVFYSVQFWLGERKTCFFLLCRLHHFGFTSFYMLHIIYT